MLATFQDLQNYQSYNELLTATRTLTPEQVLRIRELIHLLVNGRRIFSHAPDEKHEKWCPVLNGCCECGAEEV